MPFALGRWSLKSLPWEGQEVISTLIKSAARIWEQRMSQRMEQKQNKGEVRWCPKSIASRSERCISPSGKLGSWKQFPTVCADEPAANFDHRSSLTGMITRHSRPRSIPARSRRQAFIKAFLNWLNNRVFMAKS